MALSENSNNEKLFTKNLSSGVAKPINHSMMFSKSTAETTNNSIKYERGALSDKNTLFLSENELQDNVAKLKEASNGIKESWNDIMYNQVPNLENSWAGFDARMYIENVKSISNKIDAACKAIDLLANTYEKAREELINTQTKIIETIKNEI